MVNWNFNSCVQVLNGEIELLKKISIGQTKVQQAVVNRDWADFDTKTGEVNRIGAEFSLLEDERIELFSALDPAGSSETKPFYALVSKLSLDESRELSRLYRELKTETSKIRAFNETFLTWVTEAKNMASSYLEAVCPARGGKLYTNKGRKVSQDLRSMVINNSL